MAGSILLGAVLLMAILSKGEYILDIEEVPKVVPDFRICIIPEHKWDFSCLAQVGIESLNRLHYVPVALGTPGQSLNLSLSTTENNAWTITEACSNVSCHESTQFNTTESDTYANMEVRRSSEKLNYGTFVGNLSSDLLTLNDEDSKEAFPMSFIAAYHDEGFKGTNYWSGMLGLGITAERGSFLRSLKDAKPLQITNLKWSFDIRENMNKLIVSPKIEETHWQELVNNQEWSIRVHQFGIEKFNKEVSTNTAEIDLASPFAIVDYNSFLELFKEMSNYFKQCAYRHVQFKRPSETLSKPADNEWTFYAMICVDSIGQDIDIGNFTYSVGKEGYSFRASSLYEQFKDHAYDVTIFKILGRISVGKTWVLGTPFFKDYALIFDQDLKQIQFEGKIIKVPDPFQPMGFVEILVIILIVVVVVTTFIVVSIICIKRDKERKRTLMQKCHIMLENKKKKRKRAD